MKPNQTFELTVNDIEIIESALRAKAGRRGMKMLTGDGDMKKIKSRSWWNNGTVRSFTSSKKLVPFKIKNIR